MPLVTSTELFRKAYEGNYAVGAFNVNNMEIIQGIVDAAKEEKAPLILQVSAGARNYAKHIYLMKLVEAAVRIPACQSVCISTMAKILKSASPVWTVALLLS